MDGSRRMLKPNLLCIVPPYPTNVPPASAAALLAYLKANGCHDFDFLDLRLWVPYAFAPSYKPVGIFGESFVMDVPDLPLVLELLRNHDEGTPLLGAWGPAMERYCLEREISGEFLKGYLASLDRFLAGAFASIADLQFVGFSTWTPNYLSTLLAAAHLKRRKHPPFIVAGGPQVTESRHAAELGLRSGLFDSVVLGEGEEALLSLYREFRHGGGRPSVTSPGTMRLDPATGAIHTAERKLLRLDHLPIPAFEEMSIASYQLPGIARRALPYQLSRGCTDKCSFCSEWVFWERYRSDAVEHVLPQVEALIERFGMEHIAFSDSLLNGSMPRLRAFAEGLLSRGLKVGWSGFLRAKMDRETAELLRRAGCDHVFIGIESFSDETLQLMNKRRTQADNLQALELLLGTGIHVVAGVIPGFPGDSRTRFSSTVEVLRSMQSKYPNLRMHIDPFTVSPGQPIFGDLPRYGLEGRKWDGALLGRVASRYGDVVDQIYCTVEGANQGVERMGQLKLARHHLRQNWRDLFSYQTAEAISAQVMSFEPLEPGWMLGEVKTATALIYSIIVSDAEAQQIERLQAQRQREAETTRTPASGATPLLQARGFRPILSALERDHVIAPSRITPRIHKFRYAGVLDARSQIATSPFVIARMVGQGRKRSLMIVEARSRWKLRIDPWFAPILLRMRRSALTLKQIESLVARQARPFDFDAVCRALDQFREKGMVVVCEDAPVELMEGGESTGVHGADVTSPRPLAPPALVQLRVR